jgi:hypothetical protein
LSEELREAIVNLSTFFEKVEALPPKSRKMMRKTVVDILFLARKGALERIQALEAWADQIIKLHEH